MKQFGNSIQNVQCLFNIYILLQNNVAFMLLHFPKCYSIVAVEDDLT